MIRVSDVRTFFAAGPAALVEVTQAKGSTPRERGAWMLVSAAAALGTIGGGQLEFLAIARAREALTGDHRSSSLDVPLGPEIGQCCGGRVELAIRILDRKSADALIRLVEIEERTKPTVLLFGGGHVGHALAAALALLPLRVSVVETRAEALDGMPAGVTSIVTAVPETCVRDAPAGSAVVVLTHDHALDFLIVAEALSRDDLSYVGMIGSATKRATFRNWYLRDGGGSPEKAERLICPIGGSAVRDKRPEVIAALAAAEIVAAVLR